MTRLASTPLRGIDPSRVNLGWTDESAIFAALIGLSLSLLFLRRPLTEVTTGLAQRRAETKAAVSDEAAEDAAIEQASADERPQQEGAVGDRRE